MALSNSVPPPTREAASAAMRDVATDIGETIARSGEVIQQAREAMARANLITDSNPKGTP